MTTKPFPKFRKHSLSLALVGATCIGMAAVSLFASGHAIAQNNGRPSSYQVAVAASLYKPFVALVDIYTKTYPEQPSPILNFASSSLLARQILAGATPRLYITADERWLDLLSENRKIVKSDSAELARNSLVLATSPKHPVNPTQALPMISDKGDWDRITRPWKPRARVAIAEKSSAPLGRFTHQTLTGLGVASMLEARVVPQEDARATAALVAKGYTDYGILYKSDAISYQSINAIAAIDPQFHEPIRYWLSAISVIPRGTMMATIYDPYREATHFVRFLFGELASDVLREHGYVVPKDSRQLPPLFIEPLHQ